MKPGGKQDLRLTLDGLMQRRRSILAPRGGGETWGNMGVVWVQFLWAPLPLPLRPIWALCHLPLTLTMQHLHAAPMPLLHRAIEMGMLGGQRLGRQADAAISSLTPGWFVALWGGAVAVFASPLGLTLLLLLILAIVVLCPVLTAPCFVSASSSRHYCNIKSAPTPLP